MRRKARGNLLADPHRLWKVFASVPDAEAPLYDTELYTTESMRHLSEEIIREKCFEILNHEIPYQLAVH